MTEKKDMMNMKDRSVRSGLTESDEQFLREYRRSLPPKSSGELLDKWLHRVIDLALPFAQADLPFADLIAEGNLALAEAIEREETEEEMLREAIVTQIEAFLERMRLERESDDFLAFQVNALSETIDRFRETYGEKPTIDELANEMGVTQEKILDILKLTGEDPDNAK